MPRGRSSGRGSRLRKVWSNMLILADATITTTQQIIGSVTISEGSLVESTLLRSRGELLVTATPDAATDKDVVGLGLCIVSANALAVGGTSIPGPIADMGSDLWLWHRFVPLDAMGATTEVAARTGGTAWARVVIDAKAMRRVPQDSAVVLVAELNSATFASVVMVGGCRFLFGV